MVYTYFLNNLRTTFSITNSDNIVMVTNFRNYKPFLVETVSKAKDPIKPENQTLNDKS